jgi:hypothetical protein
VYAFELERGAVTAFPWSCSGFTSSSPGAGDISLMIAWQRVLSNFQAIGVTTNTPSLYFSCSSVMQIFLPNLCALGIAIKKILSNGNMC